MKNQKLLSYTVIVLLAVSFIAACSDNGSDSGEEGQPPSLPNLSAYSQPDISYFQGSGNAKAPEVSVSTNFVVAQSLVLGFSSLTNIGQIYVGFLTNAQNSNATFNDGVWEWDYSYNYGGNSSSVRLVAEETSTAIDWDLFISLNSGELAFDNYNMMSGTTQNDGLEGNWTFYAFTDGGTGEPFLTSEWTAESETDRELTATLYDGEGTAISSITYQQDDNEYMMTIDYTGESSTDTDIYWDTEAEVGYIDQDGEDRQCWEGRGQNSADVPCSEIGF